MCQFDRPAARASQQHARQLALHRQEQADAVLVLLHVAARAVLLELEGVLRSSLRGLDPLQHRGGGEGKFDFRGFRSAFVNSCLVVDARAER